jgi:hypothetical protein
MKEALSSSESSATRRNIQEHAILHLHSYPSAGVRTSNFSWFVSVTVFQVLAEGVFVIFLEAGATEQAEDQGQAEASVDSSVAQQRP